MPHPIYGDPNHELHQVVITITLPRPENGGQTSLAAHGRSDTCRTALWTLEDLWSSVEQRHGYEPADAASHIVMVSMQDHPTSQRQVEACMVGEGWAQEPLF